MLGITIFLCPLPMIVIFHLGIIPTMWYSSCFIVRMCKMSSYMYVYSETYSSILHRILCNWFVHVIFFSYYDKLFSGIASYRLNLIDTVCCLLFVLNIVCTCIVFDQHNFNFKKKSKYWHTVVYAFGSQWYILYSVEDSANGRNLERQALKDRCLRFLFKLRASFPMTVVSTRWQSRPYCTTVPTMSQLLSL